MSRSPHRPLASSPDLSEKPISPIERLFEAVGGVLFPVGCPICGRFLAGGSSWPLCPECRERLEPISKKYCRRCGAPFPLTDPCPDCLEGRVPGLPDRVRSAARYSGPVRDLILAVKMKGREDLADWLACPLEVLAQMEGWQGPDFALVPVPLYPKRLRERGFNLPDRMARSLAGRTGMCYRPGWLERVVDTPPQKYMNLEERLRNVRDAFRVPKPGKIRTGAVILVDDVMTSGATLAAAALAFSGVDTPLYALTLARVA